MSSAHRPTWAPAVGKESRGGTKILLSRDIASHTKLKFRQVSQTPYNLDWPFDLGSGDKLWPVG